MHLSQQFADKTLDEIKAALAGGTLKVYSVARPVSADIPVERSGLLVAFTFAAPAFGPATAEGENPLFVADAVPAADVGTPGFARAFTADGTIVADFSAGPGPREIKFGEVSCTAGAPVKVVQFKILPEHEWPERPDYYTAHPRTGYALPAVR